MLEPSRPRAAARAASRPEAPGSASAREASARAPRAAARKSARCSRRCRRAGPAPPRPGPRPARPRCAAAAGAADRCNRPGRSRAGGRRGASRRACPEQLLCSAVQVAPCPGPVALRPAAVASPSGRWAPQSRSAAVKPPRSRSDSGARRGAPAVPLWEEQSRARSSPDREYAASPPESSSGSAWNGFTVERTTTGRAASPAECRRAPPGETTAIAPECQDSSAVPRRTVASRQSVGSGLLGSEGGLQRLVDREQGVELRRPARGVARARTERRESGGGGPR